MRNAAERHDFFADLPVRRNADAVIVSSFDIEPAEVERLKHMHVPIVGINIPSTDGFDAGVSIDDYAATRSAIEHLIALGHRHIAFVGSAPTETNMRYSAEARLQGVIDAAAAHPGIELTPLSIQRGLGESNAALNAVLNASPSITASVLRMMKWPRPCCIAYVNTGGGYLRTFPSSASTIPPCPPPWD